MSLLKNTPNNTNQPPGQNQNQNQTSGSNSRFNRPNNQQNNTNNPFATPPKPANNNAPPKPNQTRSSYSRFSGTPNRFGASEVTWIITPTDEYFVRFDLNGLGDPFHRLLGVDLNLEYSEARNLVSALENGGEQVTMLQEKMEAAWETYKFNGAGLVYPWKDEIKQIIATQPMLQINVTNANTNDDDDYDDNDTSTNAEADNLTTSGCLRSIDMLLVLNVLARTRADLLLGEAPITFESGFLERSLVTNEPRIVALARATGCVEEHFNR